MKLIRASLFLIALCAAVSATGQPSAHIAVATQYVDSVITANGVFAVTGIKAGGAFDRVITCLTSLDSLFATGGGGSGANNFPTSLSYSSGTGNLTLGRNGLSGLAASLDGRHVKYSDTAAMLSTYALTANHYTKVAADARYLQSYTETDPKRITTAAFTGTTTKTLTLTHADATTTTANFTDDTGAPGAGITSINGDATATQTIVVGSTGTDFNIATAAGVHTIHLPTASGSNRGLLSPANWTTFNNKQPALGFTAVPDTRTVNGHPLTGNITVAFADLTSKPTTISGYGIVDAFTQATADGLYSVLAHTHTFASLTSKPTTLSGYGIVGRLHAGSGRRFVFCARAHAHLRLSHLKAYHACRLRNIRCSCSYSYSCPE